MGVMTPQPENPGLYPQRVGRREGSKAMDHVAIEEYKDIFQNQPLQACPQGAERVKVTITNHFQFCFYSLHNVGDPTP